MANPWGGTEQRYLSLFEILGEHAEVRLWSEEKPHPYYLGRAPIQRIAPPLDFPKRGTLVFVGTFFFTGAWVHQSEAERIILIHNLDQPRCLREFYGNLVKANLPDPEVLFACEALKTSTPEIPGQVQDSPIDIRRFTPKPKVDGRFTIGRVSRDVPEKHHPDDPDLYLRLADLGVRVRIMGGTCLDLKHELIDLLPQGAMPVPEFLSSLDAFYFRTHPSWFETFGRVNFEALACGLPIIAERRQGYVDRLTANSDSLLFNSTNEAEVAILRIRDDLELRRSMSLAAREKAERLFGPEFHAEIRQFYLGA